MKKLFLAVLVVFLLTGCATLGIKPSEDQLSQMEQGLIAADFGEAMLFTAFDQLCTAKKIDEPSCVIGYTVDREWTASFNLAMEGIANYRLGKQDKAVMQQLVAAAMQSYIRISNALRDLNTSKPASVKIKREMLKRMSIPKKP